MLIAVSDLSMSKARNASDVIILVIACMWMMFAYPIRSRREGRADRASSHGCTVVPKPLPPKPSPMQLPELVI